MQLHVHKYLCARACARVEIIGPAGASPPQGARGPDKVSSLRNYHMTILHSSLHKYIHVFAVYPRYTHSTCVQHCVKNEYMYVLCSGKNVFTFSWLFFLVPVSPREL